MSASKFNGADAAFFGLELIKRDPLLTLTLVAVLVGVNLLYLALLGPATAEFMASVQAVAQSDPENPDLGALTKAYGDYFSRPAWLIAFGAWIVAGLSVQAAALRALVLDARTGPAGLRFGADEIRLLPVNLVIYVISFVVVMLGVLLGSVLAGVLGALLSSAGGAVLGGVVGVLVLLGASTVPAWFAAMLSPAAAATIGEKRIVVFEALKIAGKNSWSLLGAYVLLVFIFFVVGCVVVSILWVLNRDVALLYLGQLGADYDVESLKALLASPGYIASQVVNGALAAITGLIWLAVGAYAYRQNGAAAGFAQARPWGAAGGSWPHG